MGGANCHHRQAEKCSSHQTRRDSEFDAPRLRDTEEQDAAAHADQEEQQNCASLFARFGGGSHT